MALSNKQQPIYSWNFMAMHGGQVGSVQRALVTTKIAGVLFSQFSATAFRMRN
jgi:hypothetical protein